MLVHGDLLQFGPEPLGKREGAALVRVRHEDGELVAAQAGRDIAGADVLGDDSGQVCDHDVADAVTVFVVDRLQPVDIQHNQRERLLAHPGAGKRLLEALVEVAPVVELGQLVVGRHLLQLHGP